MTWLTPAALAMARVFVSVKPNSANNRVAAAKIWARGVLAPDGIRHDIGTRVCDFVRRDVNGRILSVRYPRRVTFSIRCGHHLCISVLGSQNPNRTETVSHSN